MSSDDSGFDKEAEREKLRKKFEQDEKDRENTRRMSELLLQGATMTGKHCDDCGDPIFRYDGQEFCPTCQHEARQAQQARQARNGADAGDTSQAPAASTGSESTDADQTVESTETDESTNDADDEPRVEINGIRVADERTSPGQNRTDASDGSFHHRHDAHAGRSEDGPRGRTRARDRAHASESARDRSREDADLTVAREALVRKLTDLARRAEETDDVTRVRELLAATREAAEALAALDRANH